MSVLTLVAVIVLLGCSKPPAGVYKEKGGDRVIELKSDGTFRSSAGIPYFKGARNGTYRVSDQSLLLDWGNGAQKDGTTADLVGDHITFSDFRPNPFPQIVFIKQQGDSSAIGSSETKSDAASSNSQKAPSASLDDEAVNEIRKLVEQIYAKCGASYYTQYGGVDPNLRV